MKKILIISLLLVSYSSMNIYPLFSIKSSNIPTNNSVGYFTTTDEVFISIFYWWYPWYDSTTERTFNGNYYIPNNFSHTPVFQIPYIKSPRHPDGLDIDSPGARDLVKQWYYQNFEAATEHGVDVIAIPMRNDLVIWNTAFSLLIETQQELKNQNKRFPKISFFLDGFEHFDGDQTSVILTSNSDPLYIKIRDYYIGSFTLLKNIVGNDLSNYYFTYKSSANLGGEQEKFVTFFYRIEGSNYYYPPASNVQTNNLFLDHFRNDLKNAEFPVYTALESMWCPEEPYGINNIKPETCNADNYFFYGGARFGYEFAHSSILKLTQHLVSPRIIGLGPGFDTTLVPPDCEDCYYDRDEGLVFSVALESSSNLGYKWFFLETLNFGEEGNDIMPSEENGWRELITLKSFVDRIRNKPKTLESIAFINNDDTLYLFSNLENNSPDTVISIGNFTNGGQSNTSIINKRSLSGSIGFNSRVTEHNLRGNTSFEYLTQTDRTNAENTYVPAKIFFSGDWNGDGITTLGIYEPAIAKFTLINSPLNLNNQNSAENYVFNFGPTSTDGKIIPLSGDWNGDGIDNVAIYKMNTGEFALSGSNTTNYNVFKTIILGSGSINTIPFTGDWNGDGRDGIGIIENNTVYLLNNLDNSIFDISFTFTRFNINPYNFSIISGNWFNNGFDNLAFFDKNEKKIYFTMFYKNYLDSSPLVTKDLRNEKFSNSTNLTLIGGKW